jgi:hypothetical protein
MASFPRTNGIGNATDGFNFQQGTIRYTQENINAFIINAGEALTTKDGDAAYETQASIESILNIVRPVAYYSASTDTNITVITDYVSANANILQTEIQARGNIFINDYITVTGTPFWNNTWANLGKVTVTSATSLTAA